MNYTPEAMFIPASKTKVKAITVNIAGTDYNFPPNEKVSMPEDILKLIIGNWDKPSDRAKDLVKGISTPACPRDQIYRIVDNQAINLFGVVDVSDLLKKAEPEKPKE